MLQIFNTLSGEKEAFTPIKSGHVGMYSCGPTVYNYMHIGNLRAFVFADILKRTLTYNGYRVDHIMNLTDVDDKTIRDSQKNNMSLADFTQKYTDIFLQDIDSLNLVPARKYTKATDHINEMIEMTQKLIEMDYAYVSDDGSVYFAVAKFPEYGALSGVDTSNLKANADARMSADEYDKDNVQDFALWKSYTEDDGDVKWDSPWGPGRPGWHIECSAMATKHLGNHFDIHTGGVDNIFPHHDNEIAQCNACAPKGHFVNYWAHNAHLLVDDAKMSKSLGNFYTLENLREKGFSPLALRYFFLSGHYRHQINFTWEALQAAQNALEKLTRKTIELKKEAGFKTWFTSIDQNYFQQFMEAINDDLETPQALAVMWNMVKDHDLSPAVKYKTLIDFDRVLGLGLKDAQAPKQIAIPAEIQQLADERKSARESKDWATSDELRDKIADLGYSVKDTENGQELSKS